MRRVAGVRRALALGVLGVALAPALVGCTSSSSTADPATDARSSTAPHSAAPPPDAAPSERSTPTGPGDPDTADKGCYVDLFDGENFDPDDDHYRLTRPGSYVDLAHLPGADKDWTDEADGVRVGPRATVVIYAKTNFAGTSRVLKPGSEIPDLEPEPSSLRMAC